MKKLILLLCIPFIGIAQTDYELAFNSTNSDYVEMPNASSLIVNSTTFSLSAWVYPQANPAAHSAIMGFRNNTDADFYLLQLQNSNNVEARFRNSSGTIFDVLATNLLDFNQWQHLAFTYDGSNIYLYKNGFLVSSTPANGVITQMSQTFKIGALDWGATGFYMNGSLDEIRLWNATLSPSTITNWMCAEVTTAHPDYSNLAGYWRLNDGAGTTATDLSVNSNNGTLNNNPTWQVTTSCFASTTPPLTYVPDDNFENYLEANGMGDGIALNDSVLTANINTVTYIDVSSQNISDLTGIEDFTALTYLDCDSNQLTSLGISNNTALWYLNCNDNQITILDVSNNTSLNSLNCERNQLTTLDVSNNINLEDLFLNDNFISVLNLSQNSVLRQLRSSDNPLGSLDIINNPDLTFLDCGNNQLVNLNISQNVLLERVLCRYNQILYLDITNNTALYSLYCHDNQLISLDVSNNPDLTFLACGNNQINNLDLRNGNNIFLDSNLSCSNNPNLTCIDVDDASWSTTNWTFANGNIDTQHYFSTNCSAVAFDCTDSLEVTDVIIDNTNLTMNIAIYNGYNYFLNYPYVAFTIDANGDTIQAGNMNLFGANNLVTTWYNYSISNVISPAYPLTMYFVYSDGSLVTDTCILTYNTTSTAINDINPNGSRKLIKTIDVLGRENKGTRNKPLFYIYDDGVVEKKIIIE